MEEIMLKVPVTLTYIKPRSTSNIYDVITTVCGMIAATLVALKFPQPYFGIAFWFYVVSAACAVRSNYLKKTWPMMLLFSYFFVIDSIGVIKWWPW